jgi:hypothetical protein
MTMKREEYMLTHDAKKNVMFIKGVKIYVDASYWKKYTSQSTLKYA